MLIGASEGEGGGSASSRRPGPARPDQDGLATATQHVADSRVVFGKAGEVSEEVDLDFVRGGGVQSRWSL